LGYREIIEAKDLLVISINGEGGDYDNINLVRAWFVNYLRFDGIQSIINY
jgi:hypothetical protein